MLVQVFSSSWKVGPQKLPRCSWGIPEGVDCHSGQTVGGKRKRLRGFRFGKNEEVADELSFDSKVNFMLIVDCWEI